MNKKDKAKAIIITLILAIFVFLVGVKNDDKLLSIKYQVYLDGKAIGIINDTKELYNLINKEQSTIKNEYNVDQVYPPKGFEIEKYLTYNNNISSVNDIYNQIKNSKSFTVKGYTATISSKEKDGDAKVLFKINVLDKSILEKSIQNLVKSFVDETQYENFINGTQTKITDVGSVLENVYFNENITIKENYLSIDDKIYTSEEELTQFLMFGDKRESKTYTVKKGDTISSIANDNELNPSEFLVANPQFTSANNMLAVGEVVNVELIDPQLTLVVENYVVEDTEVKYDTEIKYDSTKPTSYRVVETAGQNGIQRVAKHVTYENGAINEEAVIDKENTYMIKEVVNEVIIRGNKSYQYENITGTYIDTGTNWAWPTNSPYILSSGYGWRWGAFHAGQDITGTGYGSPIYAIGAGEVIYSGWAGMVGKDAGLNVVIDHKNGYYSVYAHLSDTYVKTGDYVDRKQKIGGMGRSGNVTGTHLHLTISVGAAPYQPGYKFIDPMQLWR